LAFLALLGTGYPGAAARLVTVISYLSEVVGEEQVREWARQFVFRVRGWGSGFGFGLLGRSRFVSGFALFDTYSVCIS
jgi:hypothetical protein